MCKSVCLLLFKMFISQGWLSNIWLTYVYPFHRKAEIIFLFSLEQYSLVKYFYIIKTSHQTWQCIFIFTAIVITPLDKTTNSHSPHIYCPACLQCSNCSLIINYKQNEQSNIEHSKTSVTVCWHGKNKEIDCISSEL